MYLKRIHNKCWYILVRNYMEPDWSGQSRNRYETIEYSQKNINVKSVDSIIK